MKVRVLPTVSVVAVTALVLVMGSYPFIISRAKLELGGASPNEAIVGTGTSRDTH